MEFWSLGSAIIVPSEFVSQPFLYKFNLIESQAVGGRVP